MSTPPAELDIDAIGLRCPLPVIRLAQRAADLPPGTVVTIRTTDPAARHDLPAWARMRRHTVLDQSEDHIEDRTGRTSADTPGAPVLVTRIRLDPATGEDRRQREA